MTSSPASAPTFPSGGAAPARSAYLVYRIEIDQLAQLSAPRQARVRHEARARLEALLGPADLLADQGDGFELTVVGTTREQADELAQRILYVLGTQPFDLGEDQFLRRTASIGWAPFPWQPGAADGPDTAAVRQLAERALFLAQRSGSNQCVGILPMDHDRDGTSVRLTRVHGPDLVDEPTTPMRTAKG
jgi:GGDEF domain-containing protein